jgi:aldehyde:ferredoxin oxidoreductase
LCGVEDVQTVLEASRRCDEAGMDTLSAGGTIALAMECVERGWLELPWLKFGNSAALLRCLEAIEERAGWGYWLGEGSRRLAEYLGGDAPRQAMHVKGLELPGYDPRTMQTLALGLATAARGADHNRTGAYEIDLSDRVDRYHISPEHARWAVETEDTATLLDSLILCKFLRGVFTDLWDSSATILQLVTGWNITAQELKENVQRIITLKKYFNMRCGWSEEEDDLPARFFEQSPSAAPPIARDAFRQAIRTYYQLRGWDEHGVPGDGQIAEIDADLRVLANAAVSHSPIAPVEMKSVLPLEENTSPS